MSRKLRRGGLIKRFAAEYVRDLDAGAAYTRAGGTRHRQSAQVSGHRLMRDPAVQVAIRDAATRHLAEVEVTAARVIRELGRIAFADPAELVDVMGNYRNLLELPPAVRASVASFELLVKNAAGGDGHQDVVHKVRLWDKNKALETLAKYFGLLIERVEHDVSEELLLLLDRAREQNAQGALPGGPRLIEGQIEPKHPLRMP